MPIFTYSSTDTPRALVDRTIDGANGVAVSTISVPDQLVIQAVRVSVNIAHTYVSDLSLYLNHGGVPYGVPYSYSGPQSFGGAYGFTGGSNVELSSQNGGNGHDYVNTRFDDGATTNIRGQTAPFTGTFRPEGLLNNPQVGLASLAGQNSAGTWTLMVIDDFRGDVGTILSWTLEIDGTPVVQPYTPSLNLRYDVAQPSLPALNLLYEVIDADLCTGTPPRWMAVVWLGGVNVSERLIGHVRIEANSGAARIAEFTLAPAGGVLDPMSVIGAAVQIEYAARDAQGNPFFPIRLFTGRAMQPEFDAISGVLRITASDDLQAQIDAMNKAEIDALTPDAHWSSAVHQAGTSGWEYAQQRMQSLPADLDCNVYAVPRVTAWAAGTPIRTLTANDHLDGSLRVELAQQDKLINRVRVEYRYRWPRLRLRQQEATWNYTGPLLINGQPKICPAPETIRAAVDGTGWRRMALQTLWTPVPTRRDIVNHADYTLRKRSTQVYSEPYVLTVEAPNSIAQFGARPMPVQQAGLMVGFDVGAWESDDGMAPQLSVTGSGEAIQDYNAAPEDGRGASDEAIRCLLNIARTRILSSHRTHRVSWVMPIAPCLDLPQTLRIQSGRVTAQGRITRLVWEMDPDAGLATTEVSMAISRTGVEASPDDPLDPPPPPTPPDPLGVPIHATLPTQINEEGNEMAIDWSLDGYAAVLSSAYWADPPKNTLLKQDFIRGQFRVTAPEIPESDRQPIDLAETVRSYSVSIPEDDFLLQG